LLNDTNNLYRLRKDLINAVANKNYIIFIFCNIDRNNFNNKNIKLINTFGSSNSINPFFLLINFFIIFVQSIIHRPILIYSFTIKPNIYAILISFFLKIKSISTFSGLGNLFLNNETLYKFIFKIISVFKSKNNFLMFHNEDDKLFFKNKFFFKSNNLFVINGSGIILKKKFIFKKYNELNILTVMRPLKEKGIEDYITLINNFYDKSYDKINKLNFFLVTTITKKNMYYNAINQLLKKKRITIINGNQDFENYYENCNIYLSLSKREGLSQSMIKSMHYSNLIISLDVVGCRKLIANKKNGFLLKNHDIKNNLTDIFNYILDIKNNISLRNIIKNSYNKIDATYSQNYINNIYLKYVDRKN